MKPRSLVRWNTVGPALSARRRISREGVMLGKNQTRFIRLHGTAEHVVAPSTGATHVLVRPLGRCALEVDQEFGNDDGLLLISLQAPIGDPILGFLGWHAGFGSRLIGVNVMPAGKTTVLGLPDRDVALVVFMPDNSPGFGIRVVRPGASNVIKVPIVAGWSDALHEPPAPIQAILDLCEQRHLAVVQLLGLSDKEFGQLTAVAGTPGASGLLPPAITNLWHRLGPLDRKVELPGGTTATVADVLAAKAYQDLPGRRRAR